MKRHPSLIPLSREHHGALILSRLLQKDAPPYIGLPHEPVGKAKYALKFYREELKKHFAEEEKILPVIRGVNSELDKLMQDMVTEHRELDQLFNSINEQDDLALHLDKLGRAMEVHIRKEERQIFPLIQDSCSDEILRTIAETLST